MAESTFLRLWRALPRDERITWVCALAFLLPIAFVGPASRAFTPRTALIACFVRDNGRGPWGHPLRTRSGIRMLTTNSTLWNVTFSRDRYSVGPNGKDEGGFGDDVALETESDPVNSALDTPMISEVSWGVYLAYAREGLAVLAGLLALVGLVQAGRRVCHRNRLAYVAGHAALFGYLSGWLVVLLLGAPPLAEALKGISLPMLQVSPRISIALTSACLGALVAGYLSSRSLEREPANHSEDESQR